MQVSHNVSVADLDPAQWAVGFVLGFFLWAGLRYGLRGFYTVAQNERAVKTVFGRAKRVANATTFQHPMSETLKPDERSRYNYPQVEVIPPGGPYFKWPWERIHKISVATFTASIAFDPESATANYGGTKLEAVTKDHLNTGLVGQIRYRISEQNLYACLFSVRHPIAHVLGYFISILRERIANFEAPARLLIAGEETNRSPQSMEAISGISINDLRKNLRDLNEQMERECASSVARYGIILDACLITGIEPPNEVESALAAINTAHNHVSSEVSLAQAAADQRIVLSRRAVEIETLQAKAEVEPLLALAEQLAALRNAGPGVLATYLRNVRLGLFRRAHRVIIGAKS